MRTLAQHAFLDPEDYDIVDSKDWPTLPKKVLPDGTNIFDQQRGWITAVNIQGVIFQSMDHYAVIHVDNETIRMVVWNDDPEDHLTDFHAYDWTFKTPASDPRIDGRINTRQTFITYAETEIRRRRGLNCQECTEVHPWENFIPPSENMTRHGIWMPNEIMEIAKKVRRATNWREWIE